VNTGPFYPCQGSLDTSGVPLRGPCPPGPESPAEGPPRYIANNLSPYGPSSGPDVGADQDVLGRERRFSRYALRALLWRWSGLPRVRCCGRIVRSVDEAVGLRRSGPVAGFSGLQHCGSVWSCPVCSSKVLARRAVEIGAVLALAASGGFLLGFGTFTMRHRRGEPVKALWAAARAAWQRSISGKSFVAAVERFGVVGWVRVWEVTDGRNGWHVHVHWVAVLAPGSVPRDLDGFASGMLRRWRAGLAASGREALDVGQDWRLVSRGTGGEIGAYLSKLDGLGLELAHSQPGRSRAAVNTRPVWSLLHDFAATGDMAALSRWREWEAGSKGAQQVGWSRAALDLRKRFGLSEPVLSDEEVAMQEFGSKSDEILRITKRGWASMVLHPDRIPDLLTAAEVGGLDACRDLLDAWGDVEYVVTDP